MATSGRSFRLDISCPKRKQQGEANSAYNHFLTWCEEGYPSLEEFVDGKEINLATAKRYSGAFDWQRRRDIIKVRESQSQAGLMFSGGKEPKKQATKVSKTKDSEDAGLLLPAPAPIERGLHKFALEHAHVICPGFTIDAIVDVMLTEFENIIEGPAHGRMLITPHPRAGKTNVAIIALVYSLLRQPDRGQALISANGRLATISNQMMRTLFEHVVPEGYGISKDSKSKLAWKPNWQNAKEQLALSRDAALLGYTISGLVVCDDIAGSASDIESENTMESIMRTLNTDIMTRLTKDASGKGGSLVVIGQRLGPADPTGRMIDAAKLRERNNEHVVPYTVVATPFLNPTLEEQARIIGDFPDSWHVKFPHFGEVGEPVSSRFTKEFARDIESTMSPRDFAAMYKLQCTHDNTYCAWRRPYLQPIEPSDIRPSGSFIAIDMNLTGEAGSDESALCAATHQDGKVVILGLHALTGYVEDILPQIYDFAEMYNAHTIGVEKAAAGHQVLRQLSGNIGGKVFNVAPLSHQGKSKRARQQSILGFASQGKLLINSECPVIEKLHDQMRSIALDRRRDPDDLADATIYACSWVWERWVRSGFVPGGSPVTWGGGAGTSGATPCSWSFGTPQERRGLDGVTRYVIPGFD